MINCMIAGVGGQGTVLASKLIAEAAILSGSNARTAETIGMAQRGGSVVSHVRIGKNIYSPLIPRGKADVIIAFEPAEAVRILPYLKPDGMAIVCDIAIKPSTGAISEYNPMEMLDYLKENVKRLKIVDGKKLLEAVGNAKVMNVAMLGEAARESAFPFDITALKEAIQSLVPQKYHEMNLQALNK